MASGAIVTQVTSGSHSPAAPSPPSSRAFSTHAVPCEGGGAGEGIKGIGRGLRDSGTAVTDHLAAPAEKSTLTPRPA